MSQHHDSTMAEFLTRTIALGAAWFASWTIGDVQQLVGIVSGVVLICYTLAQWRALRRRERDASKGKEPS